MKTFAPINDLICSLDNKIFVREVEKMLDFIPEKDYTSAIADIPYGFKTEGSSHDEEEYKYI
jgi:hypothetical protein